MKKMRIGFGLALCLFILLSGVAAPGNQNAACAATIPMISVNPSLIDLGDREMGSPFSANFTVSLSAGAGTSAFVLLYTDQCSVSPTSFYLSEYLSVAPMVTGVVPQTFGEFYRTVTVSGPSNLKQVVVRGNALYPAPTNASLEYNAATSVNHFHCDPVPGATSYSVLIINLGGGFNGKRIALMEFPSNDATFTLALPSSSGLRFSVTARNADDSKRSLTTVLLPVTVQ